MRRHEVMPNGREERIKGKSRRMVEGREGRQVEMERQEEAGESNEGWKTIGVEGWGRGDSPGHCLVEKCLETPCSLHDSPVPFLCLQTSQTHVC